MIDSLLNYRAARKRLRVNAVKVLKPSLPVSRLFSLFFRRVMYFTFFRLTLEFTKYFNITNGDDRERNREESNSGDEMWAMGEFAEDNWSASTVWPKNTYESMAWLIFKWMLSWQVSPYSYIFLLFIWHFILTVTLTWLQHQCASMVIKRTSRIAQESHLTYFPVVTFASSKDYPDVRLLITEQPPFRFQNCNRMSNGITSMSSEVDVRGFKPGATALWSGFILQFPFSFQKDIEEVSQSLYTSAKTYWVLVVCQPYQLF